MAGKSEREISIEFGSKATEARQRPPLKHKYLIHRPAKNGGQKRSTSNSGGVGRAGRRRSRGRR